MKIVLPIKPHYAGSYRIEYDGKYITLFGKDKTYPLIMHPEDYDEMVLVPCVKEIRRASPRIVEVTDVEIIIETNHEDAGTCKG